jgi:hypothetical protein
MPGLVQSPADSAGVPIEVSSGPRKAGADDSGTRHDQCPVPKRTPMVVSTRFTENSATTHNTTV